MAGRQSILLIDDKSNIHSMFKENLNHRYDVIGALNGETGLKVLGNQQVDLVVLDLQLPDLVGLDALKRIRQINPSVPIIIMTADANANVKNAVEAMKAGANDYMVKPIDFVELEKNICNILTASIRKVIHRIHGSSEIQSIDVICNSSVTEKVYNLVRRVAATEASVLIQGESGTGKEVVAWMLHSLGDRKKGPFLPINCAALPENLLEAELFGYEAGAFTGANKGKPGKFELAENGTLLLDEIGDMPLVLQAKLLRVLEERKIERLGGTKRIKINIRLVAATNKDLSDLVEKGTFREDLYYRLAVIPIYLPPLRDRREEILPLTQYFLKEFAGRYKLEVPGFNEEAKDALVGYSWPGNVRELRNLMERLVVLHAGREVQRIDLPEKFWQEGEKPDPAQIKNVISEEKEKVERVIIFNALKQHKGNRTRTAEYLGVSRRWLQMKLKEYQIQ